MTKHGLPLLERLMSKIRVTGECWIWEGYRDRDGYGLYTYPRGTTNRVHRLMYALEHGLDRADPSFKGKHLDHLCRNRGCVRASHLELVTPKINAERGSKATQTHCIHGHEFTEKNTYRKANGTRYCRSCRNERTKNPRDRAKNAARAREYRARKKETA